MPDEQQLADRACRGDQVALAEILRLYQGRLYNTVLRMVNHREDAAEITQDALLKVVEHVREYNGQCHIATWMTRIAMNLSISHLRKRRLRKMASLDAPAGSGADPSEGDPPALVDQLADPQEPGPDCRVQNQEMQHELHLALGRLEEDFRAVLTLRDVNQMDYQQIAETLGVPVGTVKSRLFRARLALRHEMLKIFPPPARRTSVGEQISDG